MIEPTEESVATPEPDLKPGGSRRRAWAAIVVFLLFTPLLLVLGSIWSKEDADPYEIQTRSFIRQMNRLGRTLGPGGAGIVSVPRFLADEIILVSPYSPHGPTAGSQVDWDCILVWMRDRRIASTVVFPSSWIEFEMEGYPSPQMWRLDPRGEIHLELVYNSLETKGGIATFRFPDPGKLHRVNETPREVEKP